ncbi:DUF397 domain-containing protein [Streptomyces sp. SID3343]|uniref:DUF397 domain-containing protein n=1 Tax=Streptomyces sp. SID3343 TaxID=2690260 RepID=UPI00136A97E0|nr:DUF397 domain-containing protein [Streptomyces sp. SID3343]MYW02920.1 DUF397 domain-containing protein [Streptomyces sp. SID3343]
MSKPVPNTAVRASALGPAEWFKSSASTEVNQCVTIAHIGHLTAVRDSKDDDGPAFTFGPNAWRAFLAHVN